MKFMKRTSNIFTLFIISFISFTFFSCNKNKGNTTTESNQTIEQLKIAYVNMDSVYAHLEYFQEMKAELQKLEANMTSELQGLQRNIINTQNNLQKRIKNKDISEEEMMNVEKKLVSMNNNLQKRQETLTAQFMEKQNLMAMDIEELTNAFYKEYNKDKKYDLILANNQLKTVFYADEKLDITAEITVAFNDFVKKIKRSMVLNETLGKLNSPSADSVPMTDSVK